MQAKYIGDANTPGEQGNLPDVFEAFGLTFEKGKFTDVPADLAGKFEGNSHFETGGADKSETVKELADRIQDVDDVEALYAELETEKRATGKTAIEARIAELEAE